MLNSPFPKFRTILVDNEECQPQQYSLPDGIFAKEFMNCETSRLQFVTTSEMPP
jgi:hypothetical protein